MGESPSIQDIAACIEEPLERLGASRALLFGSHARGTEDARSDIDLLVIDDRDEPYLERIERYFAPLDAVLRRPFEILVYTSAELEKAADRPFIRTILQEGVGVYERGKTKARS